MTQKKFICVLQTFVFDIESEVKYIVDGSLFRYPICKYVEKVHFYYYQSIF